MDNFGANNELGKCYTGLDWQKSTLRQFKPNDCLQFCDLRDSCLDGLDLSEIKFLGCRLNGTSFQGARLQNTYFIGCFSSEHGQPTDLQNCTWQDVFIEGSHLYTQCNGDETLLGHWPEEVAEAAWGTLSERNDVRYDAAQKLGMLGNPIVAPLLACLLVDREWDVRAIALRALGQIRTTEFPYSDQAILQWMFSRLGDEHSIVRQTARDLVEELSPPDEVLHKVINGIRGQSPEERLASLLAAVELCRYKDEYCQLVDLTTLQHLLSDEIPEIRSECLHLLGILDYQSTIPWILAKISDPITIVRVAALNAIQLLSEPPTATQVLPLLNDPDEAVRIEALYTLGQIGDVDQTAVKKLLFDPSAEVQRLAQSLLDSLT
ncbi:HEAT repeat domain-containing protein [Calothrix membranacea FACHB-236]|nr:HEAT repeat domain-containing protein [Calothrix membranacea FACHB-236]